MAQNIRRHDRQKDMLGKVTKESAATTSIPQKCVLVGTYKRGQMAWIQKYGVYNYPLIDEDTSTSETFCCVRELWLYAGLSGKRFMFSATFVGIQTLEEFLTANPTYAKLGKTHHKAYFIFKVEALEHESMQADALIIARVADFVGRTKKVVAALKSFLQEGELGALAEYLPADLANVPSARLKVCESTIQLDFLGLIGEYVSQDVPFPNVENARFTYIDLFAGIGGFHLAMHKMGGRCVFASEWDKEAQRTYIRNYGIRPFGDITKIDEADVPDHDVLCAGFPCQPFSKAGKQMGFADETKGTLFFDIERILRSKIASGHPTQYIILENVRNLVSHDSGRTWKTIFNHLKTLGYRLTPEPLIVSPHYFGIPQLRERVLILGVFDPQNVNIPLKVNLPKFRKKSDCNIHAILEKGTVASEYYLTEEEIAEINLWDEFYSGIQETVIGFPIWVDSFQVPPAEGVPDWKRNFILKNNALYKNNRQFIDEWLRRHNNLHDITPTMRKMEWQVGNAASSLWECLMQKRPSGLRVKRADCAPALVAIVQVPIVGTYRRRMTVREAARLQSFPDDFIPNPNKHEAYKQFGNAVNVEVIRICSEALFALGHFPSNTVEGGMNNERKE